MVIFFVCLFFWKMDNTITVFDIFWPLSIVEVQAFEVLIWHLVIIENLDCNFDEMLKIIFQLLEFTAVHWIWNLYLFLISCSFRRSSKRESICLSTESENSCVVLLDSLWCLMLEDFILFSPWPSNISSYWFCLELF